MRCSDGGGKGEGNRAPSTTVTSTRVRATNVCTSYMLGAPGRQEQKSTVVARAKTHKCYRTVAREGLQTEKYKKKKNVANANSVVCKYLFIGTTTHPASHPNALAQNPLHPALSAEFLRTTYIQLQTCHIKHSSSHFVQMDCPCPPNVEHSATATATASAVAAAAATTKYRTIDALCTQSYIILYCTHVQHPLRPAVPGLSLLRLQLQSPEFLQSVARLAVVSFSRLLPQLSLCLYVTGQTVPLVLGMTVPLVLGVTGQSRWCWGWVGGGSTAVTGVCLHKDPDLNKPLRVDTWRPSAYRQ